MPEVFPSLNDDLKLGIIEFQSISIDYDEEIDNKHAMVSFYSPYLENQPKSSQVLMNADRIFEFDGDKLPVLSFIFASPDVLKQIRCILILDLISNNGETQVAGYSNIALKEAVEFIQSNYHIDEQVSFSTNRSILIQKDLELNSKRVGQT